MTTETKKTVPDWVTFPEDDWTEITPEEAGLDPEGFQRFLNGFDVRGAGFGGEDHTDGRYGAVLTRGGYLVHTWGDRHYRFQTASVGKAFSWALIGLAVADGLINADEPINKTWTGEGQLSHPHKYLTAGHHRSLTWRHLVGPKEKSEHYGGFPMELGLRWRNGQSGMEDPVEGVQEWTTWTGDPFYDLYSHVEPGTIGHYSSAGFWRLGQALTAVWDADLKDVLDEKLFGKIGISPNSWDWLTGEYVKDRKYFYPTLPDSYTYLDHPYEINGHPVRSGPGWVVISASDLARYGHLNATGGVWKGEQVIDPQWLRGHSGGNKSGQCGEGEYFTAMGAVTTVGLDHPYATATASFIPKGVFIDTVRRSNPAYGMSR